MNSRLCLSRISFGLACLIVIANFSVRRAYANDWPQFLGPTRSGVYAGNDMAAQWPKEGPPTLWKRQVGQGFSGPAVASGKLILFHRVSDKETIDCFNATTGKTIWSYDYPTKYRDDFGFDEGPRATPQIADGLVYSYGAEGILSCLDFASGTNVWRVNVANQFHASKGFFGIACSPLVEGNAVLLGVGGADGNGILAFDKSTGKVLWKTLDDEASYSSPVPAMLGGDRCALVLTRSKLSCIDPSTGKLRFQFAFRPPIRNSVTAASPLVVDDMIFLSASYGTGATLLKIKSNSPEKVWSSDDALSNHYATSVYHDGFLYGIHGRTDPGFEPGASLRCIEFQTGNVRWKLDSFGAAIVTLAGDHLLILTEKGELISAPASPTEFKPSSRAQVMPSQVRAHPALANGLFYARSKDTLVCVDLRKGK